MAWVVVGGLIDRSVREVFKGGTGVSMVSIEAGAYMASGFCILQSRSWQTGRRYGMSKEP
jgi:hypothetical protein